MKKTLSLLFCLIIISALSLPLLVNASVVTVLVNANSTYNRLEHASIAGILAQDGSPISNGLVGIQITYPNNNILTMRTVNTGGNPQNQIAIIQSVYLSDQNGNQISSTPKGSLSSFRVLVTNNDQQARSMLITLTIYDNYNSPIGFVSSAAPIQGGETRQVILSVPISSAASPGIARVFADVYSDEINEGGVPYCQERSSTFTINVQQGSAVPDTPNGNQGSYTLPFTIPINAPLGTYKIDVSSVNNGLSAFSSRTFTVRQAGDFNGDGKIDANDITTFVISYINYWNGRFYNQMADFDHNDAINVNDISQFVLTYIQYWSWQ